MNDIATRPAKKQIVIKGSEKVHYGTPKHFYVTAHRIHSHLCHSPVIMLCSYMQFATLDGPDSTWALEPHMDCPTNSTSKLSISWLLPQEIQSIGNTIWVASTCDEPVFIQRNSHICQITPVAETGSIIYAVAFSTQPD